MEQSEFETLAAFRASLRRFLKFSDVSAGAAGLTSQAYQALLAIKGRPNTPRLTVGDLAECLLIKHNSAVGLADRLVSQGYLKRKLDVNDRRRVFLLLTSKGEILVSEIAARNKSKLIEMRGDFHTLLNRLDDLT